MQTNQGFIALISVILIGAFFSAASLGLVLKARFLQQAFVINYDKQATLSAAESCIDIARLLLLAQSSYSGNEYYPIHTHTCYISALDKNATSISFTTVSSTTLSSSQYKIILNSYDISVQEKQRIFQEN